MPLGSGAEQAGFELADLQAEQMIVRLEGKDARGGFLKGGGADVFARLRHP